MSSFQGTRSPKDIRDLLNDRLVQKQTFDARSPFLLSAILHMFGTLHCINFFDSYFTGKVNHDGISAEKEIFQLALVVCMMVKFLLLMGHTMNPTHEACIYEIGNWMMWSASHIFGALHSPDFDRLGFSRVSILVWPFLGLGFIFGFLIEAAIIPPKTTRKYSPLHMFACALTFTFASMFLSQPEGCQKLFFRGFWNEDPLAKPMMRNLWCVLSLEFLGHSFSWLDFTKNTTKRQNRLLCYVWLLWATFLAYLLGGRPDLIENLGINQAAFQSCFYGTLGLAYLFYNTKPTTKQLEWLFIH